MPNNKMPNVKMPNDKMPNNKVLNDKMPNSKMLSNKMPKRQNAEQQYVEMLKQTYCRAICKVAELTHCCCHKMPT
jgi:hypothetical protein